MRRGRLAGLTALAVAIAGCAVFLALRAHVRTDMAFLLPGSPSAETRLVVEQLRTGPTANLVFIRISGAAPRVLAGVSDRMVERLRSDDRFTFVANGRISIAPATLAWLRRYRYLLNPPISTTDFDVAALRRSLRSAIAAMATTAGLAAKDTLASDPTGRVLRVVRHLADRDGPRLRHGVWFARNGPGALIVARTAASGLEIGAQAVAIEAIRTAFSGAITVQPGVRGAILEMSGSGVFAVAIRDRTKRELTVLSVAASLAVILLLLLAVRSIAVVGVFGVLLATSVGAGAVAVQLAFGEIHAITLTFGATLMGLAIDYPLHVLAHTHGRASTAAAAEHVGPTLRLSAFTTAAAFLPFAFSSFPALAQLGVMSIVGLLVAAAISRWVLPLVLSGGRALAIPTLLTTSVFERLAKPRAAFAVGAILLLGAGIAATVLTRPVWQDDLTRLSPLPRQQIRLDQSIRSALGAPNPRLMVLLRGSSAEQVLRASEAASRHLAALRADGALRGFIAPSRYLPSAAEQVRRQGRLPDADVLRRSLKAAQTGLPFRPDAFQPFVRDVEAARRGPVADRASTRGTLIESRLDPLLFKVGDRWFGLVPLVGIQGAADRIAASKPLRSIGAKLIDLKAQADALARNYRIETLVLLGISGLLVIAALAVGRRRLSDVAAVFLPVLLSVGATGAVLVLTGAALSVFHLMSLFVVAGIGLDYALFLRQHRGSDDRDNTRRSVLLCGLTTIAVYSILATSAMPILQGIGLTIAAGTGFVVVFASSFVGLWCREQP